MPVEETPCEGQGMDPRKSLCSPPSASSDVSYDNATGYMSSPECSCGQKAMSKPIVQTAECLRCRKLNTKRKVRPINTKRKVRPPECLCWCKGNYSSWWNPWMIALKKTSASEFVEVVSKSKSQSALALNKKGNSMFDVPLKF